MSTRPAAAGAAQLVKDPVDYVDPMIGTGRGGETVGEINNFPGPAAPFGMMQFSPDTDGSYAGYQYHSDRIRGFSLDHASVGCTAFGDVPILPVTGDIGDKPWERTESFSHEGEEASAGHYAVTLKDSDVRAELAATTRTGMARFTFPEGADEAQVLVKGGASLAGNKSADMRIEGDRTVTGSATTGDFCGKGNEYTLHYAVTFDRPFSAHGTWDGSSVSEGSDRVDSSKAGAYLTFGTGDSRTVRAKVSMSYVSVDGARANMAEEVPGWDLDALRAQTREQWATMLGRVKVAGRDEGELKTFYTALYHSLMHPNTFNDADGRYIGFDDKVRTLPKGRTQYANFSDWDTYRSLAPLQAMLFPKQASDMAQSLVNDAEQGGWWPRWPVANDYTGQMTGDNSVPLVANLYAFGARDFDLKTALKYVVKGATSVDPDPDAYQERPGIDSYMERGYLPNNDVARGDHQRTGASTTLEWAIDDFAIAQLAKAAGDKDTARDFTRRGQNWQNVLNTATGYLQPRGQDGRFPDGPGFVPPPDGKFGQDGFDEGNAAQYNWLVPQNVAGLVESMGGRKAAAERLDTFFGKLNAGANEPYMWAGNEVNFGVPWVYNHLGQPWKTQEKVREIANTLFSPTPDGEPGNDDLGAQSSWYVWAALGMYPSTPGTDDLAVHSPLFERAVVELPGDRPDLDIRAPGATADTAYVHELRVDGRDWERTSLPQTLLERGGRLDFGLQATPDKKWATASGAEPPSYRTGERPFLAQTTPNLCTVEPGGKAAKLTVHGQRLGGDDTHLTVRAEAPEGLDVSPAEQRIALNSSTGKGSRDIKVVAPADAPEGYHEIEVTVSGAGSEPVRQTVTVLVAPEGSLAAARTHTGISDDADRGQGDHDGDGNSYSRQALADEGLKGGARVEVSGTSFVWPAAPHGAPDQLASDGRTLELGADARDASRMVFVGSAVHGDQRGTATVTFTDGSTAETDLSFGDWTKPGGGDGPVFGNTVVAATEYRNESGGKGPGAFVHATAPFGVPDGKTLKSVTLPDNSGLRVFAVGLG